MSAFRQIRHLAPVFRSSISVGGVGAQRTFHSCRALAAGKESALHDENRASKVEAEKQDQLKKQKQGDAQWKDSLASDSESIVKADRGDIKNASGTIEELQKESAKLAEKEHKGS